MVALFVVMTIIVLLGIELIVGKLEGRRFIVAAPEPAQARIGAMAVPEGTFFHRGHAWARVENDGMVTVGIDDFARAMAGRPDEIRLPQIGGRLAQGADGWTLTRSGSEIPMLSPVDGEVVAANDEALKEPSIIAADPYEKGWLLKVRPTNLRANIANLLDPALARRWLQETYERLSNFFSPELGVVMQDGGMIAEGIIEHIEPERQPEVLREFFLVEPETIAH